MRVAFATSPGIDNINGGLRQQFLHTMEGVRSKGNEVLRVRTENELRQFSPELLHVFSVGFETIEMIRCARLLSIPLVLSPVMFTNHPLLKLKWGLRIEKTLSKIFSRPSNEMIIKEEGCLLAEHVLPNTGPEADLLRIVFGIEDRHITVIPNGVEPEFENGDSSLFETEYGIRNFVLFAGQASAKRKNVISLLRISKNINKDIVIIGDFDDNPYSEECLKLASEAKNVTLIPTLDHDSELLRSAYAAAEVFILPSWFETPGIAAMEAALAGCKIVITNKGGTQEYFGEYAEYVDPHSDTDIQKGINNALHADHDADLKDHIKNNYLWEHAVTKTLHVYEKLLKRDVQL